MRICFFGTYARGEGYPVNRVLIKGLERAGAQVFECREDLWGPFLYRAYRGRSWRGLIALGLRAAACYARLVWRYLRSPAHEVVVVGYAGYLDVHLARLLAAGRGRHVLLVSFISLYDTLVCDRQEVAAASWRGRWLWHVDHWAFRAAHAVLADTEALCAYYATTFGLPRAHFVRSFVGEDDDEFGPRTVRPGGAELQVLFFGTYVPLHGVEVIVDAATALREDSGLRFTLVGAGQLYPGLRRRADERGLAQVSFVDRWVSTAELVERIAAADVCLGIFGQTAKAERVIPYKVYDALAVGRP
ncbi:MAG: glycosyltransferase, partial [Gemmatimonadota bacterium]